MAFVYFPSCKFIGFSPDSSEKVCEYLFNRFGMRIAACCRKDRRSLTKDDTAVLICHTCAAICEESSSAGNILSLWEIMDGDNELSFPDFKSLELTVQDCWRSSGRIKEQMAVRSLLKKMNISVIEQEENFEKTKFCGKSLYNGPHEENNNLVQNRFGKSGIFTKLSEEEQISRMTEHCRNISTDAVLCHCVTCAGGIEAGGKKAVHLLDLIYNKY